MEIKEVNLLGKLIKRYVLSDSGFIVSDKKYSSITPLQVGDHENYIVKKGRKFGLLDEDGEELQECVFDEITFCNYYYLTRIGKEYGALDLDGYECLFPQYSYVKPIKTKQLSGDKENLVEFSIGDDDEMGDDEKIGVYNIKEDRTVIDGYFDNIVKIGDFLLVINDLNLLDSYAEVFDTDGNSALLKASLSAMDVLAIDATLSLLSEFKNSNSYENNNNIKMTINIQLSPNHLLSIKKYFRELSIAKIKIIRKQCVGDTVGLKEKLDDFYNFYNFIIGKIDERINYLNKKEAEATTKCEQFNNVVEEYIAKITSDETKSSNV